MTEADDSSKDRRWRKSPEQLVALFASVLPDGPDTEKRQMFGYPCAFVNGNMFAGLHQESLIVRLNEVQRQSLIDSDGAEQFEPMPGRVMKEYVSLPVTILDDQARLVEVIASARQFAALLPPKTKKPRKKKAS